MQEPLDGQEQDGLGYLVAVHSVFLVADRRYGQYEMLVWEAAEQGGPQSGDVLGAEEFPAEFPGRVLVAVGDYDVSLQVAVDPGGAECDQNPAGFCKVSGCLGKGPVRVVQELFRGFPGK